MASNSVDIEEYIEIGEISQFLASDDIAKKSVFGNPYPVPFLPNLINLSRRAVQFNYEHGNYSQGLQSSVNWMYSLCQPYAQKALTILNNATGIIVIPSLPSGDYFIQLRSYPQFIVGAAGAPMNEGDIVLTIIDADAAPQSSDGECEVHRSGLEQGEDLTGVSTFDAVFAPGSYTITFSPPVVGDGNAATSELIQIKYPITRNLTYAAGTSTAVYQATLNGAETKTLIDQNGNIYPIPDGTTGNLTFTLFCISTVNDIYVATWQGSATSIGGVVQVYEVNRTAVNDNFPLDFSVSGDNVNGGVKVEVTGAAGKVFVCKAKLFSYQSDVL